MADTYLNKSEVLAEVSFATANAKEKIIPMQTPSASASKLGSSSGGTLPAKRERMYPTAYVTALLALAVDAATVPSVAGTLNCTSLLIRFLLPYKEVSAPT